MANSSDFFLHDFIRWIDISNEELEFVFYDLLRLINGTEQLGLRTKKGTDKKRAKTRKWPVMIRCLHRTVGSWFMAIFSIQSVLIWYSFIMCTNICITGTASPRSWYLHPQTHDRDRDRTERILQAQEQILERDEEEPDTSTHRLAAEVGVSQLVVHRTLKEH